MKNFILNLQFIFRPSFWIMTESYCPAHDRLINELMDNHEFTRFHKFTAYLGNHEIWLSNYPYCVGVYRLVQQSRPSRLTILRMKKKFRDDIVKNYD